MPPTTSPAGSSGKERDPRTFLWLREHNYRDNLKALDSVQFRRPAEVGDQYLDVGCGPGNFVAEALLPRLGHCRRLIATDKAASMVEYAREHYPNPAVVYDVLDIERGDVQSFVGKYGLFDRVYSFMAFHYVNDLERAYRNVFLALKDGGEFMRVSFTGTAITDVWYQLCCTEEWKAFLSNPKKLLSQRFCYCAPIPMTEIADNEEKAAAAAGLELVSCQLYDSYWTKPDVDSWLDSYVPFFRLDSGVPAERRAAFREAFRSLLLKASMATPKGRDLRHSVIVVHAQKPPRP
ncbi:juvenile hormone acid O-methyltransferase-like [Amblyomma americanum]